MGMMAFFTRRDPAAWAMRPETQREAIVASLLAWAWAVEARRQDHEQCCGFAVCCDC